ncbi:coilin [Hippocampus comes]|uniref:Coilin n=1 Tax=Hippocampus comes TaxID=109280 RepID=A0A3Q3D8C9_HIPCM|nr:PREDICTED: coilin [Hippocampus comes]
MAAHCSNHIRVRLHFDYPPPAVVDCRMCWLLVDLNTCRMVSDLESIIRDKFEFSRQSIINLFIDDCYLLHTESIYVVRDNDRLRVKVDCVSHLNGKLSENCKSRQRLNKPNLSGEKVTCVEWMGKKRKKNCEEILEVDINKRPLLEEHNDLKNKRLKKKRQKVEGNGLIATDHPAFSLPPNHKDQPNSKVKKIPRQSKSQNTQSPSYNRNGCVQDDAPNATGPSLLAKVSSASKIPSRTLPAKKCSPSSSDTDSSDEDDTVDPKPKNKDSTDAKLRLNQNSSHKQLNCAQKKHSSASVTPSDQIATSQESCDINGFGDLANPQPSQQQSLSNEAESTSQDYSAMPLLAAPPQVGQKIAFKLLELTENYTPEVSEYKKGKIVSFDPTTKQIERELLSTVQAPSEPGKFDLVYQNPDGSETVEYALSRGSRVTERWESLLEPRLMI